MIQADILFIKKPAKDWEINDINGIPRTEKLHGRCSQTCRNLAGGQHGINRHKVGKLAIVDGVGDQPDKEQHVNSSADPIKKLGRFDIKS